MTSLRETTDSPQANTVSRAPKTWVRDVGSTGRLVETCPAEAGGATWCEDSHDQDQHSTCLDDLQHGFYFSGPELPVFDATDGTALVPVLAGRVQVDPYSRDLRRRRPHLNFEPFQDEVMECLTPDDFAQIIGTVRAHCDRLDEVHARFAAVHAEWTETQA
ncbi:DUF6907 domain-containing protein [Streptomyces sp. NPDC088726]|uniref:DUF6907 domain-containing protein n=1 Tax=Streptomyces sp. NPDC088726 TaxID=3365874 RepID=UPI003811E6F7